MCFSANASFAASGVLAVAGIASVREAKSWRAKMYAAIPFLFSIQQFIEGLQWLAPKPGLLSTELVYGFLFFALALWPVYVPVSVYLIEPKPEKRQRLGWFAMFGALVSAYSLVLLLVRPMALSGWDCCHLVYQLNMPFGWVVGAVYVVTTCGSMFFSSHGWVRVMGVAAFLALLAAFAVDASASLSVWCYFAAVLSVLVFLNFRSGEAGFKRLTAR